MNDMGMFDEVRCEFKLSRDYDVHGNGKWQTKSFAWPYMDQYKIDKDGMLWVKESKTALRYEWNECFQSYWKGEVPIFSYWEFIHGFTGELNFYSETQYGWTDIQVLFIDGKVIHVTEESNPI